MGAGRARTRCSRSTTSNAGSEHEVAVYSSGSAVAGRSSGSKRPPAPQNSTSLPRTAKVLVSQSLLVHR